MKLYNHRNILRISGPLQTYRKKIQFKYFPNLTPNPAPTSQTPAPDMHRL